MSIVLEALEKAQKAKAQNEISAPKQDTEIILDGLREAHKIADSILKKEKLPDIINQHNPSISPTESNAASVDIPTNKNTHKLKLVPVSYKRHWSHKKIFIITMVLVITASNIVFLGWWLNRGKDKISLDIPVLSSISRIIDPQSKKKSEIDVTGVVWDEKDPIAIVNGKFLKKGDEVAGARIIDIKLREVKFVKNDTEFTYLVE